MFNELIVRSVDIGETQSKLDTRNIMKINKAKNTTQKTKQIFNLELTKTPQVNIGADTCFFYPVYRFPPK
jgi:hypothetical protein